MGKISFFFREAAGSLRRNYFMTLAALLTVVLTMTVLGVVMVFAANIDNMLADFEEKVEVTVYLEDSAGTEEIEALQSEIVGWTEVKDSQFVSKDEALQRLRKDFEDNPDFLEVLSGNPLPASFEITLKDPKTAESVAGRFEGREIVNDISYGKELADRIFQVTSVIRNAMAAFIAVLAGVSVMLISNTIRLSIYARRREVEIMKLVGATNWFIRWPFMIEGLFVGVVGAGLAFITVLVGTDYIIARMREVLGFLRFPLEAISPVTLAAILLGAGALVGVLGSGLGLRRFLKI